MDIKKYLKNRAEQIDLYLDKFLPEAGASPKIIHKAMRYSIFSGGKRLRPILAIEACSVCGGSFKDVISTACGIEAIHTCSLIHDDLPSMDDDDYRRGKPTLHRKFNEAVAILAGDALLALGFNLMAKGKTSLMQRYVVKDVSKAIGTFGMIGGQVMDISTKRRHRSSLERIHARKTGALIAVSLRSGAIVAKVGKKNVRALTKFGELLGLSFQIIDDLLDKEDYFKVLGERDSRKYAEKLINKAKITLKPFGKKAKRLEQIADFVLTRKK